AEQPHADDLAQLGLGEAELSAPVGQDVVADREAHAGGDEGEKARPEQDLVVEGRFAEPAAARHGPLDAVAHTLLSPSWRFCSLEWEDGDSGISPGRRSQT